MNQRVINLASAIRTTAYTALAYSVIYAFEYARAFHFDIPPEYITVGLPQVLAFGFILQGLFGNIVIYVFTLYPDSVGKLAKLKRPRLIVLTLSVIIPAELSRLENGSSSSIELFFAFVLVFALPFVIENHKERKKSDSIVSRVTLSSEIFYFVCFGVLAISISLGIGSWEANRPNHYQTVVDSDYKGFELVWTANDLLFLRSWDPVEKRAHLVILKVEKENTLEFARRAPSERRNRLKKAI